MKRSLLYVGALAPDIVALLIGLVILCLWGNSIYYRDGVVWVRLDSTSWPARTWYRRWAGTTFGHVAMLSATADPSVNAHELIHVEQYEGQSLRGLLVASALLAAGQPWWGLAAWVSAWWLYVASNCLVAWLRGKPAYLGAAHEEHAYAVIAQREVAHAKVNR